MAWIGLRIYVNFTHFWILSPLFRQTGDRSKRTSRSIGGSDGWLFQGYPNFAILSRIKGFSEPAREFHHTIGVDVSIICYKLMDPLPKSNSISMSREGCSRPLPTPDFPLSLIGFFFHLCQPLLPTLHLSLLLSQSSPNLSWRTSE